MNGLMNDFYNEQNISAPRSPRSRHPFSSGPAQFNRAVSQGYGPPQGHDGMFDDLNQQIDATRYGERMNPNLSNTYGGFDMSLQPPAQAWNSNQFAQNQQLAALGATTRARPGQGRGGRAGFPQVSYDSDLKVSSSVHIEVNDLFAQKAWMDRDPSMQSGGGRDYPPFQSSSHGFASPLRQDQLHQDSDEDLIPTAIVIKNIPFAVKKEQLVEIMTNMSLPLPYAFNYHFDNGIFRGLAFANFSSPEDTSQVIVHMNHLEVLGRKLRVEYKKMLPQHERDKIEREKREKRGQLEEQHRPTPASHLHTQSSMNSMSSHVHGGTSPSPVSARGGGSGLGGLDMNDPLTFEYYSQILLWANNEGDGKTWTSPEVPPSVRTVIHRIAHSLNLDHESHDTKEGRCVRIAKNLHGSSTPLSAAFHLDPHRRQLNRAATTDFSNVRNDSFYGNPPQSPGHLGFSEANAANLRAAKSNPNLRSREPSPSSMRFPSALSTNVQKWQEHPSAGSPGSGRAAMTPTTMSNAGTETLINGLGGMTLNNAGSGFGPSNGGNGQRLREYPSFDNVNPGHFPTPIGAHRSHSGNQDENRGRNMAGSMRNPPRNGVVGDRTTGSSYLRRQNGHQTRGSDELSSPSGVDTSLKE
ncbi:MAG: hypothetical protein M1831_006141 [Alyxoria varia]|nr:MAG: hypothetical protein M1831_006141 [Alyxoria varia]